MAIGAALGMDGAQLRDLRRAGLLHDIGKLAVSNRILDKPGRLTEEEFAAIREHPRYTQQILERVAASADRRDRRLAPRAPRRLAATTAAWPPSTSRARRASSPSPTSSRR